MSKSQSSNNPYPTLPEIREQLDESIQLGGVDPTANPTLVINQDAVTGVAGNELTNSGTWGHPTVPDNVSLTVDFGAIIQNNDGTWTWTGTVDIEDDQRVVLVVARVGTKATTGEFTLNVTENSAPAIVGPGSGNATEGQQTSLSGTWSDPDSTGTPTMVASVGNVTVNANGTWEWTYTPTIGDDGSTVTITVSDGLATNEITFTLNVNPASATPPLVSLQVEPTINPSIVFVRKVARSRVLGASIADETLSVVDGGTVTPLTLRADVANLEQWQGKTVTIRYRAVDSSGASSALLESTVTVPSYTDTVLVHQGGGGDFTLLSTALSSTPASVRIEVAPGTYKVQVGGEAARMNANGIDGRTIVARDGLGTVIIDGNSPNKTQNNVILTGGGITATRFQDLRFFDCSWIFTLDANSSDVVIDNCVAANCKDRAFYVAGATRVRMNGCEGFGTSGNFDGSPFLLVSGSDIEYWECNSHDNVNGDGYGLSGADDVRVTRCDAGASARQGLRTGNGLTNCVIDGGTWNSARGSGIQIEAFEGGIGQNVVIKNASITLASFSDGECGAWFDEVQGALIQDCVITLSGSGVRVDGDAEPWVANTTYVQDRLVSYVGPDATDGIYQRTAADGSEATFPGDGATYTFINAHTAETFPSGGRSERVVLRFNRIFLNDASADNTGWAGDLNGIETNRCNRVAIYNNTLKDNGSTLINGSTQSGAAFNSKNDEPGGNEDNNISFFNNVIDGQSDTANSRGRMIILNRLAAMKEMDFNTYHDPPTASAYEIETVSRNFAAHQSFMATNGGFEADSEEADPLLDANHSPQTGSPVLNTARATTTVTAINGSVLTVGNADCFHVQSNHEEWILLEDEDVEITAIDHVNSTITVSSVPAGTSVGSEVRPFRLSKDRGAVQVTT